MPITQAWCPFAVRKPIPEAFTQPEIVPYATIWHSAGGSAELQGWWNNPQSKGLESHFFVDDDPQATLYQYMPITRRADANGEANLWVEGGVAYGAISVETASTTHASEPWSPAQVRRIEQLQRWIHAQADIPMRQMRTPRDWGIGWHVMFGAPGPWTKARGKVCPGPARIVQLRDQIIPRLAAEPVEPTEENILAAIDEERFKALEDSVAEVLRQVSQSQDPKAPDGATLRWITVKAAKQEKIK